MQLGPKEESEQSHVDHVRNDHLEHVHLLPVYELVHDNGQHLPVFALVVLKQLSSDLDAD